MLLGPVVLMTLVTVHGGRNSLLHRNKETKEEARKFNSPMSLLRTSLSMIFLTSTRSLLLKIPPPPPNSAIDWETRDKSSTHESLGAFETQTSLKVFPVVKCRTIGTTRGKKTLTCSISRNL